MLPAVPTSRSKRPTDNIVSRHLFSPPLPRTLPPSPSVVQVFELSLTRSDKGRVSSGVLSPIVAFLARLTDRRAGTREVSSGCIYSSGGASVS